MKFNISVYPEKKLVIVKAHSQVSQSLVIEAFNDIPQHPDFEKGFDSIWDFRESDKIYLTADDLIRIQETRIRLSDKMGKNYKVALLSSGDLMFGMTRMYSMLGDGNLPFETKVFRSFADALDWLGVDSLPDKQ